ncbi:hypothetical protein [uncultured Piscinibacter sp.]|uniref:hypothetical protein n=1 Tax=uncultured Piscinibacter sp. TaxID=1131835 RepID=UPI00260D4FBE|nr:hypothetical protein [uncultured Piscinibacter sp.]
MPEFIHKGGRVWVPIVNDDGTQAYRYRVTAREDCLRSYPLLWPCPDEATARVMAAIFAGDFSASPRSRPARPAAPAGLTRPAFGQIVQDGIPALAALGVPATVACRPTRRVPPQRERVVIKAARARAGAAVMARLFEAVPS